MPDESWKERIRRWLTVNVADTRDPDGPRGRLYTSPFARVWDALLEEIASRRRWELVHKDEELGMVSVRCRSLVFRFVDDVTVWVTLDENGLTRVEARSRSRVGKGDFGVNRRRIERLMGALDREVGPGTRVKPPPLSSGASGAREAAGGGAGGGEGGAGDRGAQGEATTPGPRPAPLGTER